MSIEGLCLKLLEENPGDLYITVDMQTNKVIVRTETNEEYGLTRVVDIESIKMPIKSFGLKDSEGNRYRGIVAFGSSCTLNVTVRCLKGVNSEFRGARLKKLRQALELTQEEVAEKTGISLRMVQAYEQGAKDISKAQAGTVLILAKLLQCSIENLIGGDMPYLEELYSDSSMIEAINIIKEYANSEKPIMFFTKGGLGSGKSVLLKTIAVNFMNTPIFCGNMCYDSSKFKNNAELEDDLYNTLIFITVNRRNDGLRYIEKIERLNTYIHNNMEVLFQNNMEG